LGHILDASGVGAEVALGQLPLSQTLAAVVAATDDWSLPLSSGDDYELCFCVPPGRAAEIQSLGDGLGYRITPVGSIQSERGMRWQGPDGTLAPIERVGYDHFSGRE
jgi:thiamine-monophosphate kinase